jgi:hypothetical protein
MKYHEDTLVLELDSNAKDLPGYEPDRPYTEVPTSSLVRAVMLAMGLASLAALSYDPTVNAEFQKVVDTVRTMGVSDLND